MAEKIKKAVEKYRDEIYEAFDFILDHPETGFKEWETSRYLSSVFEKMGYDVEEFGDIPGFSVFADTGREGPEVLVTAELDALICPGHPFADKATGAAHSCGHNAQCAALVGLAGALRDEGILNSLCGRIRLCAVPAEELIELEYREGLKAQGIISYMTGKQELIFRGIFDSVDMALMVHTTQDKSFVSTKGAVGCVAKRAVYKGRAAHAGGNPWDGCNALYAANLGLSGINALRETFREEDIIRVHPIITQGGTAVNAVPDRAVVESFVRGATLDAVISANEKVNRALCAGALALGAEIEITDTPGYSPLENCKDMISLAGDAAELLGFEHHSYDVIGSGSTDMGDLSCLMPVVHPYAPGAEGTSHGTDYSVSDVDSACVKSAQWQLQMLCLLLENGGERAKKILSDFKPRFNSRDEYFKELSRLSSKSSRIKYSEGRAEIVL